MATAMATAEATAMTLTESTAMAIAMPKSLATTMTICNYWMDWVVQTGNTKGGSITVPLTSCFTCLG